MANPIIVGGVGSPQSVYDLYTVGGDDISRAEGYHSVGTRGYLPDGRVFYYASVGATALNIGQLQKKRDIQANHDAVALGTTGVVGVNAKFIDFSESDVSTTDMYENEYKDGWMLVTDETGGGQALKIDSHGKLDASGTGTVRFYFKDPIRTALAATSEVEFILNPYQEIEVGDEVDDVYVGVPQIAATASGAKDRTDVTSAAIPVNTVFMWVQTWGPAAVAISTAVTNEGGKVEAAAGSGVAYSSTTAAEVNIGQVMDVGGGISGAGYQMVNLRLAP